MNKNTGMVLVALVVIGIIALVVSSKNESPAKNNPSSEGIETPSASTDTTEETTSNNAGTVSTPSGTVTVQTGTTKNFTVNANNYGFDPKQITVKKGDTVKITLVNKEGFHDLRIDAFNIATKKINTDQEDTISFVADKAGSFEYYCTVGNHRAMGMVGRLTVTE